MLKFASKSNKHFRTAQRREKNIRVYQLMFTLPGTLRKHKINFNVWKYFLNFHLFYKSFSSFSKIRRACTATGRARGVYRAFQLSRMMVRRYCGYGMFFGVTKSSW